MKIIIYIYYFSPQEPPAKQQKSDTLVSKASKAIQQVLGNCEEI